MIISLRKMKTGTSRKHLKFESFRAKVIQKGNIYIITYYLYPNILQKTSFIIR